MPGHDKTGPIGQGVMTGRGFGPCGRGEKRGFGGCGFGICRGFVKRQIPCSKEEEKQILEANLREIDFEKQEIEKRLNYL